VTAPPLLRAAGLTKLYGGQLVFAEVGFESRAGVVLGLIGRNGAGTTTGHCLAGLPSADTGTVRWKGSEVPPRRGKAVLFQLPDGVTPDAEQPVSAVLSLPGQAWRLPDAHVVDAVEALSPGPVLAESAGALSDGYRRRLPHVLVLSWRTEPRTPNPLARR
jgi:ABC-type multidrug transport system ATPase subunit